MLYHFHEKSSDDTIHGFCQTYLLRVCFRHPSALGATFALTQNDVFPACNFRDNELLLVIKRICSQLLVIWDGASIAAMVQSTCRSTTRRIRSCLAVACVFAELSKFIESYVRGKQQQEIPVLGNVMRKFPKPRLSTEWHSCQNAHVKRFVGSLVRQISEHAGC